MNKLQLSYIALGVSLILYVISGFSDLVETLCLVGFFANGFLYTYTLDYLPKNPTSLQSPSVFLYRRQRLNIFGYLNSIIFIIMTVIFFILQSIIMIDTAILLFICWAILILSFKYVDKYTSGIVGDEEYIYEYMFYNYPQYQNMLAYLSRSLPEYPANKISDGYFVLISNMLLSQNYSTLDVSAFVEDFKALYNNIRDYNSDEVRAIDQNV